MILARAPFRISLGGGGTDLPSYYSQYGGFILSAAIDKYIYVCVNRPTADQLIRVKYSLSEKVASVDEVRHDLVRPALKLLQLNHTLEIVSMADVPAGTGLGSSGSYIVALLAALYELKREKVQTQDLAETAFDIEANHAHHPIGKHDPYLAAFGGVTCLDIAKDGAVAVSTLDGFEANGHALEFRNRVMLFFTGQSRSSGIILEQQKQQTEKRDPVMVDSLHRTKELGYRIRDALMAGDLDQFGLLLDEHWQNKKRRAGPISDPKLDAVYDLAKSHGALGGKIIGAGGGGFFMFCCKPGCRNAVREALVNSGLSEMPYGFDHEGAKVLVNL
jgi:D-glycero-alpha-D-manno-heptose-7-phosphate kinase